MTKSELPEIIRRCPFIHRAVEEEQPVVSFYIWYRKIVFEITEEVRVVVSVIDEIYNSEENEWVRLMIKGITSGGSDIAIIHDLPIERNAYYVRKQKFLDKIFECCIFRQMVSYDDIMNTTIF